MIQLERPRRNRSSSAIRQLVREGQVDTNDLVAPLFVVPGQGEKIPIESMPGQFRFSLDNLLEHVGELVHLGIRSVCLFPALPDALKTPDAREALNPDGMYLRSIKDIKQKYPELLVMTDVALDPYSSDGHDGLVDARTGEIKNDETLEILGKMSCLQASAGADIIGPSDMMDGRIETIRRGLEQAGHKNTLIMSYTAKYASSFYGPFRDALDSAPKAGDKKTYQMDPANVREALRETRLDEREGADILMLKPGLPYLDVLVRMREATHLPLAVYNVSGEYAMIKAAAEKGWLDAEQTMLEMTTAFKRAGADIVLTYFAKELAELMHRH